MTKYQPIFNGFYDQNWNRNLQRKSIFESSIRSLEVWMKNCSDSIFHGTLRNVQHRRTRFTIAPLTCVLFRTIRNGFRTSRSVILTSHNLGKSILSTKSLFYKIEKLTLQVTAEYITLPEPFVSA